ncbi:FecR family protein [Steroidobacter cummioxidans]|uniref:FecR family protein n=1 Tax=Steroidobacter cummioxidans TaxID=1803913 RepID=UPI000E31A0B1|nr:FecR domain-containing protein [Steroidobacter cummioxidans]
MTGSTPTSADLDRMAAAADWLVRLLDAPCDEALADAWLQWCEEDPRNLQEFHSAQLVWHAANPSAPKVPLPEPASTPPRVARRTNRYAGFALAASVLIAVGIGSFAFLRSDRDELLQSYATPIAGTGSSVLPDGSRVELGADSRITTRYTASQRLISVDVGEAYFLVAKDPGRPFLVAAGGMKVTAVGTAFNVRRNSDRVVIAVSEGRVQLDSDDESGNDAAITSQSARTPLVAGQQAVYNSGSRMVTIAEISPTDVASWRNGVLKYMHEPLGSVAEDLSRYHNKRIVISDARLSAMPFTGTVFSSRIGDALKALESVFPLQVQERGDAIELVPSG